MNHSRVAGGGFNKQGNVRDLSWATRSLQPAQILKVNTEALTEFSHIYHPGSLNSSLLSQAGSLGQLLGLEKASRMHIPRAGVGIRSLLFPGSSSQVNRWSHPLDDLPQQHDIRHSSQLRTIQHKE